MNYETYAGLTDLGKYTFKKSIKALTADAIIEAVERTLNLPEGSIKSKKRYRSYSDARSIAITIIYDKTLLSLNDIADKVDRANHTCVLHHIKKCKAVLHTDPSFKIKYYKCLSEVSSKR